MHFKTFPIENVETYTYCLLKETQYNSIALLTAISKCLCTTFFKVIKCFSVYFLTQCKIYYLNNFFAIDNSKK